MTITLATLSDATKQEVFTQVSNHLLAQMKQSKLKSTSGICAYRGLDGLKCAAGCLMSNSEAVKIPENASWRKLVKEELVPKDHCELIDNLQFIHDEEQPGTWEESLKRFASYNGLTF